MIGENVLLVMQISKQLVKVVQHCSNVIKPVKKNPNLYKKNIQINKKSV